MKNYLIKPMKFILIISIFLLSYSCKNDIIHDIDINSFDQLQILRDGTKVDSIEIDTAI